MSNAQTEWQQKNTKLIGLRLNRNQDGDIIDYLEKSGSPNQTIRRLVREEMRRTGWTAEHPKSEQK